MFSVLCITMVYSSHYTHDSNFGKVVAHKLYSGSRNSIVTDATRIQDEYEPYYRPHKGHHFSGYRNKHQQGYKNRHQRRFRKSLIWGNERKP